MSADDPLRRLAVREEFEEVGQLLVPVEAALVAVDAERAAPFSLPGATWLGPEHAAGAAREAQQDVAVVVEPPAGDEGGEIGREQLRARAR